MCSAVHLIAEIQLERIAATLDAQRPQVAVVDSIQTLWSEALQSAPGSVAQVRECTAQLARHAKKSGTALFIIGHVTKEGAIAGPRVLEHIVDTVLYFEGDPHSSFRLVRAVKNRFGAVNELGVFAMTDKGLRAVSQSVGAVPFAPRASGRRLLRAGDAGRHAPAAGGDPGAGGQRAHAESAPAVGRPGAEPARHAARGAATATPASPPSSRMCS